MRKLTNEEFLERVLKLYNNEYTVLEEYKGNSVKIRVRHNRCGLEYLTTPSNFYKHGCYDCGQHRQSMNQRKTHEEYVNEVFELVGDEYRVIGKYVNNCTPIEMEHVECGNKYRVRPSDFLTGRRCPKEWRERISKGVTKSHEYFMTKIDECDDYTLLNKYVNARTKIKVRHESCGLEYEVSPHHFINGRRCPECWRIEISRDKTLSHDDFIERMGKQWFDEYQPVTKYKGRQNPMVIKHISCGHDFESSADSILSGSGCPVCKESRGERLVRDVLNEIDCEFESQYKFQECAYKSGLPFDFAIMQNGEPIGLIEYQGIQHYEPVEYFGGIETHRKVILRDLIKTTYAEVNGIPLLKIKYDVENVHSMVREFHKSIPRGAIS